MRKTDRLLLRAKAIYGEPEKEVCFAMVDHAEDGEHTGKIRARADLWDGRKGSGIDTLLSYHASVEEATEAIEGIIEAHRPERFSKTHETDVPVIIAVGICE